MMLKARLRLAKPLLEAGQLLWQPPVVAKLGSHEIDYSMCAQVLLPALRADMERLALPTCGVSGEGEATCMSGLSGNLCWLSLRCRRSHGLPRAATGAEALGA